MTSKSPATGASYAVPGAVICALSTRQVTRGAIGLDQFGAAISTQSPFPGELIGENLQAAHTQLAKVASDGASGLDRFASDTERALGDVVTQIREQATSKTNEVIAAAQQAGTGFETNAADILRQVTQKMTESATGARDAMRTAGEELSTKLQEALTQTESKWDGQLNEGVSQIRGKIDQGLAKIDEKAAEIASETWLDRAWNVIVGVVSGFFKQMWEVTKILLIIALVVIAVVIAVAAIIVLVAGLEALLAVIAAIAAFVAAAAAIIEIVLAVITIIAAVIAVAVLIYTIYQAITQEGLTDAQRGEMVSKSFFDAVLALLPVAGSIKMVGTLGRLLALAGDAGTLLRLLRLVGSVEK